MASPRTLVSAVRTSLYGGLGGMLAFHNADVKGLVDAALVGGVMADYVTWLVWSLIFLPDHLWHGCYDGCINLAFGLLLYRWGYMDWSPNAGPEATGTAFLGFMLVMAVKISYYGVTYVEETWGDDE